MGLPTSYFEGISDSLGAVRTGGCQGAGRAGMGREGGIEQCAYFQFVSCSGKLPK